MTTTDYDVMPEGLDAIIERAGHYGDTTFGDERDVMSMMLGELAAAIGDGRLIVRRRTPQPGESWTDDKGVPVFVLALYEDQGVPHVVYRYGAADDARRLGAFAHSVELFLADFVAPGTAS